MPEFGNRLDVICLESEAFYALVEEVVNRLKEKNGIEQEKWINDEEAMKLLHISSKTTLQRYRDEGLIRFSQPSRKLILYDRNSILDFLNTKAKDTF
ncbi:MAG: helix-turn-helix domain-containing protein [Saprospiraceae bacterium]|nr:helix-turn-helix domain-containing protein [Saprospiraceae bacterium]